MAVTIDSSNYIVINTASNSNDWTGDPVSPDDGTDNPREGTGTVVAQASLEAWDMYDTITSEDYSNRTLFGWQQAGAVSEEADVNGAGFAMYLGDGTNNGSFAVGGSDNYGFFYNGWSSFRLNTAGLPTTFRGTVPTVTTITRVGYGGYRPIKANGNSPNLAIDQLAYIANGNPGLLVEGGTTGDRGIFAEIVTQDESTANAWGIIQTLIPSTKNYQCTWGLQIGSTTATSYFDDSDFQLFLNGQVSSGGSISAGSMDFTFVGSGGGTNLINFDNFFIQSIGTVSNWDASDININELKWTNGQFVDMGTFIFQAQDAGNKFVRDCNFINCGQVNLKTLDVDRVSFVGSTDATGAMILDAAGGSDNYDSLEFTSDGTGHAILITATGTYNFNNIDFTGYGANGTTDAAVYNNSGGAVTINISGGTTPTVRNGAGATTTIVAAVTITLTGLEPDTEVRVYLDNAGENGTEIAGVENSGTSFAFSAESGSTINIIINSLFYLPADIWGFVVPGSSTSIPIAQFPDRQYSNPA